MGLEVTMLAYLFLIIAAAFRMPHGNFHFTPIAASLLFFGSKMPRKQAWIPVAFFAGVDVLLNKFYGYPFTADLLVTWAWYGAIVLLGSGLLKNVTALRVTGAALASSVSFFIVSNFTVWAAWSMYPKTIGGLAACYAAALPFFRNTIGSDLFFTAVVFSIGALAPVFAPERKSIRA